MTDFFEISSGSARYNPLSTSLQSEEHFHDMSEKSHVFVKYMLETFEGSIQEKIVKLKKYLMSEMVDYSAELTNPFRNEGREFYDLLYYSLQVIVPKIEDQIFNIEKNNINELRDVMYGENMN
ncbi:MAG: hypothetical protein VW683_00155 [Betaproteobacteria bacterium]|jgi:hypothetical protein